jgi:hypothetical protein
MPSRGATSTSSFREASLTEARPTPLLSALFVAFAGLALLRVALGPLVLDTVIDYTRESGPPAGKLHPALYGFAAILLTALPFFRIVLTRWEVRVVRALLAFNAGIVAILAVTALGGRGGSTGFLIDSYCGASFAILLFLFPAPWRPRIAQALLLFLALSVPVAVIEFALKTRFLPFDETETAFRPTGLASHPLELGLWMAIGPAFTLATPWSRRMKLALTGLFLLGLGVSGARTALVVGLGAAAFLALGTVGAGSSPQRRLAFRLVAACGVVALAPLGLLALASIGGLDRFMPGLGDANAQTRIDVYGVFSHMSTAQVLFGMEPGALVAIAKTYYRLETIESPLVMFVALFGALGTALFAGLFAWVLRAMLAGSRGCLKIGTGVFFLVALSSNGLSSKGSAVFLLFTLLVALHPVRRATSWP